MTQAIVKKLYFENFKSGIAKIKQSLIAIFIVDSKLPKKEQLELFVNLSYFGSVNKKPIYGFNRAAFIYYKKPLNV
ncbi:MAG: hypothetical protein GXP19_03805 [Gammaproteobacteria bacterium]|nr:hypothetical protein [Gammaproteobacteria bacterium]